MFEIGSEQSIIVGVAACIKTWIWLQHRPQNILWPVNSILSAGYFHSHKNVVGHTTAFACKEETFVWIML